jgi:guanylate kinase
VGKARAFVITGPSGVGKGTLIRGLLERVPELELAVSATTRRRRPGERDGIDYYFLTPEEFDGRARQAAFLEHATYSGNRYGTLRAEVVERLDRQIPVVLEIEVQGARQVRAALPEAVAVFIAPPSLQALRERLERRGTDTAEAMEQRLRTAQTELAAQSEFGHVIVNDQIERATDELASIVAQSLCGGQAAAGR